MEEDWRGLLNDITGMDTFKEDAPDLFFHAQLSWAWNFSC